MSEPLSPDRKPPETIKVNARYLETVLDQAHSAANASSYLDVGENGELVRVDDDAAAEAVTRADEVLTQYLRDHRAVLGGDQHWRAYYNEFDRADADEWNAAEKEGRIRADSNNTDNTTTPAVRAPQMRPAAGGPPTPPMAPEPAAGPFAFGSAAVVQAAAKSAARRTR